MESQMQFIEVKLVSGKRVMLERNPNKVFKVCEKTYRKWHFHKHFPFISFERKPCVRFKFRTYYETINSFDDPTFYADCTMKHFSALFGFNVVGFEETCIKEDLEGNWQ